MIPATAATRAANHGLLFGEHATVGLVSATRQRVFGVTNCWLGFGDRQRVFGYTMSWWIIIKPNRHVIKKSMRQ